MIKRGKQGILGFLSLCLTAAILCTMLPAFVISAAPITNKPIVKEYSVSPSSIERGQSFSMDVRFQQYLKKNIRDQIDKIQVKISNVDGLTIKNAGIFEAFPEDIVEESTTAETKGTEEYIGIQYDIHIPEENLTYKGSQGAAIKFTISYYTETGDPKQPLASLKTENGETYENMSVQKTISECVKKDTSSSSSNDEDEPIDPIGNVFVIPQDAQMPQLQAGTTTAINIPIKCSLMFGGVGSTQISVGTLPEGLSFASAGATYQMVFDNSEPKNLTLNLTADKSMKDGVYAIPLKISYKYDNTVNVSVKTDEVTAYIRVLEADGTQEGNGKLLIESYKLDRAQVGEGQSFKLAITVANKSDSDYNNVQVSLDGLTTAGLTTDNMLNVQTIPAVKKGESQTVTFALKANDKMETGSYEIAINVSTDGAESSSDGTSSGAQSISAKIFVPVKGSKVSEEDKSNASKPQIIIESYDYGGMSVVGGQEFTLKMTFRNTSRDVAIENMKMTVGNPASENDSDVAAFTPAKSSNTFFIEKIAPNESFSREIALYPKADASPKSYGVRISYKYEAVIDNARQELTDEETISIPLTQPDRFEVSDITLYGPIYMGDSASLSASYVNKGKSAVYNLSVKLEGENFTSGDMDTYIGNVESGSSDSFDTTLNPEAPGTITGKAIFTYEGPDGSAQTVEKEFSCEVMEMPSYDENPGGEMPMEPIPEESEGMPTWAKWAIGAGCVAAVVVLVIVGKKLKERKQRLLDLEDDEGE